MGQTPGAPVQSYHTLRRPADICHTIYMTHPEPEIIEAEIVEDTSTQNAKRQTLNGGEPVRPAIIRANVRPQWDTPGDHARPQGDRGGMLGGFLVLAIGFLVTVFVLLFSVCIVIPFTILIRVLGVQKRS